ncbi:MAG TPA: peptidylprolyl isomerase [Solirubrobacterales bacterium]|nr:peptidylprolyl isomerase [Solirubrobacterales bacterium]
MRRPRLSALAMLGCAAVFLAAGCGDDEDQPAPAETAEQCAPAEEPQAKSVNFGRPERVLESGQPASATVETSCGTFVIELDTQESPKTANSFAFLADEGLYDGTWFHRIVTDAFIQGGDPLGDGTGGPGYTIQEEPPPDTSYLRGIVAMAKTSVEPPGTSGSQFFVVAQADAGLSPDYAVLGQVTEGIDVVARIAALGDPASGQEGTPLEPVTIDRVTIEAG